MPFPVTMREKTTDKKQKKVNGNREICRIFTSETTSEKQLVNKFVK